MIFCVEQIFMPPSKLGSKFTIFVAIWYHKTFTWYITGSYIWEFLAKYWIFVCSAMMLIISVQEVVIYRIIYLFLFLYFVLAFQVSTL